MTQEIFEQAIAAIVAGDIDKATEIARRGLEEGIDPLELMTHGFIPRNQPGWRSVRFGKAVYSGTG